VSHAVFDTESLVAIAGEAGQRAEVFLQALRQAWDDGSSVIHPLGRAAR
jgi:hypothetical protein